ncbi:hypothetical protein HC723_11650 [Vibrio sp. S11_S32]|nr:hypothetical protein [Vibrio sp. S11_S32]MBD1577086.1 hypothetical protein [Vibrio sp. S11_S32]
MKTNANIHQTIAMKQAAGLGMPALKFVGTGKELKIFLEKLREQLDSM